jgi:hypothetical protein
VPSTMAVAPVVTAPVAAGRASPAAAVVTAAPPPAAQADVSAVAHAQGVRFARHFSRVIFVKLRMLASSVMEACTMGCTTVGGVAAWLVNAAYEDSFMPNPALRSAAAAEALAADLFSPRRTTLWLLDGFDELSEGAF